MIWLLSWNDYDNKFTEYSYSHRYIIKQIEKKYCLVMRTLKIYSLNTCHITYSNVNYIYHVLKCDLIKKNKTEINYMLEIPRDCLIWDRAANKTSHHCAIYFYYSQLHRSFPVPLIVFYIFQRPGTWRWPLMLLYLFSVYCSWEQDCSEKNGENINRGEPGTSRNKCKSLK